MIGRPRNFPVGYCSMCGVPAEHRTSGGGQYCSKHHRFMQMRKVARENDKATPSYQQLEEMLPADMRCEVCARAMNWLAGDSKATQITLQHDHDGRLRLICFGCNSRHARLPGDLLYALKAGERYCHGCKLIKRMDEFYVSRSPTVFVGRSSKCKPCMNAAHLEWTRRNRDHINRYQRRRNLAKTQEGSR